MTATACRAAALADGREFYSLKTSSPFARGGQSGRAARLKQSTRGVPRWRVAAIAVVAAAHLLASCGDSGSTSASLGKSVQLGPMPTRIASGQPLRFDGIHNGILIKMPSGVIQGANDRGIRLPDGTVTQVVAAVIDDRGVNHLLQSRGGVNLGGEEYFALKSDALPKDRSGRELSVTSTATFKAEEVRWYSRFAK